MYIYIICHMSYKSYIHIMHQMPNIISYIICQMPNNLSFFLQMNAYFETYEQFFFENLPRLFNHFKKLSLASNLYIIDW